MIKEKYVEDYKKRAKELVSKMTLEEKVYQMRHTAPAIPRLGIKAYNYWNESLHGVARAGIATVFPQAIGLGATFDEEFIGLIADVISTEGRGKFEAQSRFGDTDIYKGLTFWAPNINIFRDPRWGRGHETYGEDPYLTKTLGVSFVKGIQGNDDRHLKAAACAKHFAVHSGPESLRHGFNAVVSPKDLRETYLPAFEALVKDAGVEAVMGAYNRTNGEACCGSKTLLKDILRDEWGFDGHVTSDCWAIKDFYEQHHVTDTPAEAAALAVNNGCDLNCGVVFSYLLEAVEKGLITEEKIDEALVRVFTTRFKLGLFDDPKDCTYSKITYKDVDTAEARKLNLKAGEECVVLLKNDNMLPLDTSKLKTIGVIGPNADNRKALVGNYEGTASEYVTVLEGIRETAEAKGIRVFASDGCHLYKDRMSGLSMCDDRIAEAKAVCEQSDAVIVCLGLDASLEGEEGDTGNEYGSGDKPNLFFPGRQQYLLETIVNMGKPVILVVLSGSAIALDYADKNVAAILQGWYPGAQGGRAIANILFGKKSPEGKLPLTFYSEKNKLPDFTDYAMEGRTYRYMREEPVYPFGYGLSYTSFTEKIEEVLVNGAKTEGEPVISENDTLTLKVRVKNTGSMEGGVTVQTYIDYLFDNAPVRQLKNLKKLHLAAGEEKLCTVELNSKDFALYNEIGRLCLNKGEFLVSAGDSQPDSRSISLTGKKPEGIKVKTNSSYMY